MADPELQPSSGAWGPGLAFGLSLFLLVQAAGYLVEQRADLDEDGLSTATERGLGTRDRDSDTDDDGLADGWERGRGLDPLSNDTDLDSLDDGLEVSILSNVTNGDTDGDTILDGDEDPRRLPNSDCDGDGAASLRTPDDDADGRPDRQEPIDQRCAADVDGDGVVDGHEGNPTCIDRPDCDDDGLGDGAEEGRRAPEERGNAFDPLNPDTFGTHLPDGVSFAFSVQGQAPGVDEDLDGIPDPWEESIGLIDWGPFDPKKGQRDLLVEFVRVVGPHSGRYLNLGLDPAYSAVRDAFAQQQFVLNYVETLVRLAQEPSPALLPTRTATYYQEILDAAQFSRNPYVLTVVLNPQHNQSEIVHSGIAPIRGMLAAVDVSQFVEVDWRDAEGNYSIRRISPFLESVIQGGRLDPNRTVGGRHLDGTFYILLSGREIRWDPFWLNSPRILHVHPVTGQARWVNLLESRRDLLELELAHTIMHEMGHTLGLCHTHDGDCAALLPLAERHRAAESTMSYTSPEQSLAFLPSEWERARGYLVCPPPEPIRRLAQGSAPEAILEAKYAYTLENITKANIRSCQDLQPIPLTLFYEESAPAYTPPPELAPPPPPATSPLGQRYDDSVTLLGILIAAIGCLVGAWKFR